MSVLLLVGRYIRSSGVILLIALSYYTDGLALTLGGNEVLSKIVSTSNWTLSNFFTFLFSQRNGKPSMNTRKPLRMKREIRGVSSK